MSIQRSGSLDIRSTRTFELASKEEIEFQTVMTLTGLEDEITRIVFSYLFDLDPRFMKVGDREARKKQISYISKMQFSKVNYLEIPESVFPAKDHQLHQLYDRALKSLSVK